MSLLDKLKITPDKTQESKIFDETINEGENFGFYLNNAKEFFKKGDLENAIFYASKAFHKETADFYRCARLFEDIGNEYLKINNYDKALESIEYSISSWTKESERLESQGRDIDACFYNISRLEKIAIEIQSKINIQYKIKR